MSGAAPADMLDRLGLDWVGFPEFKYWPVAKAQRRSLQAREYEFGDGGSLENLGVMPMLLRKVDRIVVFVNTKHPLNGPDDINDSIPPLFGYRFLKNQVFLKDRYLPLVNALVAKKAAGKTVMHRERYPVQHNAHYGIEKGWEVDVLWVYNERVKDWEMKLPQPIRSMIGQGSLGSFPHYKTFFQNPPAVIDLSAKQVSLLAHLSCWNVLENADEFRNFLEF